MMSEIAMLAINTDGGVAVARDVEDDERVAGQARHEHDAALSQPATTRSRHGVWLSENVY